MFQQFALVVFSVSTLAQVIIDPPDVDPNMPHVDPHSPFGSGDCYDVVLCDPNPTGHCEPSGGGAFSVKLVTNEYVWACDHKTDSENDGKYCWMDPTVNELCGTYQLYTGGICRTGNESGAPTDILTAYSPDDTSEACEYPVA